VTTDAIRRRLRARTSDRHGLVATEVRTPYRRDAGHPAWISSRSARSRSRRSSSRRRMGSSVSRSWRRSRSRSKRASSRPRRRCSSRIVRRKSRAPTCCSPEAHTCSARRPSMRCGSSSSAPKPGRSSASWTNRCAWSAPWSRARRRVSRPCPFVTSTPTGERRRRSTRSGSVPIPAMLVDRASSIRRAPNARPASVPFRALGGGARARWPGTTRRPSMRCAASRSRSTGATSTLRLPISSARTYAATRRSCSRVCIRVALGSRRACPGCACTCGSSSLAARRWSFRSSPTPSTSTATSCAPRSPSVARSPSRARP
jgi:hypothetical protein